MDPAVIDLIAKVEISHWWFSGRRQIMRSVIEMIAPSGGAVIVDVGCGTGANIASLTDQRECVGIDPSEAAIEHARRRFPAVTFRHGVAPGNLGDLANRADLYLLMDVLEHVEDDQDLLAGVVGSMRVGGHLLITVPADMRLWSQHDVVSRHFRRYDLDALRDLWSGLPVTERLGSYFNHRLYPIMRVVRAARGRGSSLDPEDSSDLNIPSKPVNAVLRRIFAGERKRLIRAIDGGSPGYGRGGSLIALLRREAK